MTTWPSTKIDLAKRNLSDFNAACAEFVGQKDAYRVVERRKDGGVAIIPKPPPPHLGLIFGTFIHELRCALDHIVFDLTVANRKNIPKSDFTTLRGLASFPVCAESSHWSSDSECRGGGLDRVGGVDADAQAAIKSRQPWHYGDRSPAHPLAVISSLDNRDKHRELNVTVSSPFLITERNPAGGYVVVPAHPTKKEGAPLVLPKTTADLNPKASLLIALTEGGPAPGAILWAPPVKPPVLRALALGTSPFLPQVLVDWVDETLADLRTYLPSG